MSQGYRTAADDPRMLAERVRERLIVDIWERQAFDGAALRRMGLRVVFRGVPSDAGGPDYQDAILAWDEREVISGDVEFHARSSDWYRHGHDRDPRYNRVVLHVVWSDDVEGTRRADGRRVPTLAVGIGRDEAVPGDGGTPPTLLPHPCIAVFANLNGEALKGRLHAAGMRRFWERAERFSSDMSGSSPDQTAYVALLEALGYASNREAFRQLAEAVPYAWLQSIPMKLWAATLLDAAGLGPPSEVAPPAHLPPGSWRLARIRPANHPERRLLGLALLLEKLDGPLAERLAEAVRAAEKPGDLRRALLARAAGEAFIGAGRVDEVIASAVLPFVSALEPESEKPVWLFERYPSPPVNRWTRVMEDLFAQAGHQIKPRTAVEHQGIHHLYHGHCRLERRTGCPVCDRGGSV